MAAGSLCKLKCLFWIHGSPSDDSVPPILVAPQPLSYLFHRVLNLKRAAGCGQQSDFVGALLLSGQEMGESNLSFTGDVSLPFPPSLKYINKITLEKTTRS